MQPLSVPYKFLISENETYRSLSSLEVSKAVGPAGNIPKKLFKNFEPELAPVTWDIYKQSLRKGIFHLSSNHQLLVLSLRWSLLGPLKVI